MKKKLILYVILTVSLLVGLGGGSYYWYQVNYFIQTEDARVAGDMYRIIPRLTGKLHSLQVAEGQDVMQNQIVGQQDFVNLSASLLDQAVLRTSTNGTVVKINAKPGEVVSAGQTVATVVNKQNLYITANIKENDIHRVFIGQDAEFTIDAFPGVKFTGKVKEIGEATAAAFSSTASASGNFTKVTQIFAVKISIDDQQELNIIPGMSSVVKVHL